MKRVVVTNPFIGICYMSVCAVTDATDKEILEIANKENPSGTRNGWSTVVRENHKDKRLRPVICDDDKNRKHFILIC
ncbi:MAG: hypothetical protein WC554_14150 [Clostridia bacterium]